MRGRKPVPNALKELSGNPGKRPLRYTPEPELGAPSCPDHVRGAARKEWQRISGVLGELGLLTAVDRAGLAAYCVEYGRWAEAEKKVRELGLMCAPPEKPGDMTLYGKREVNVAELLWNPYLAIATKAMGRMLKFLVEFGMTPSSRMRVAGAKPEAADKSEDFLFGSEEEPGEHVQ